MTDKEKEFHDQVKDLYLRVYQDKFRKIRGIFKNSSDAEDALQSAFERMLTFWYTYDDSLGTLESWFNVVLRNCIYQTLLFHKTQGITFEDKHAESYDANYSDWILIDDIKKHIKKENPKHQAVLTCHFIHGLGTKDIVSIVGLNKSNIDKILQRFRKKIRERYEDIH